VKAYLVLADGTVYEGSAFGESGVISGEVVFNTGMVGYLETLTDPSYKGQIVVMTYPLIGNCGVNVEDLESARPALHGVVVREACRHPSNFRSEGDINQFLLRYGVIGIEGIDTRSLTRRLRTRGTMNGVICSGERLDIDAAATSELVQLARECPHADKVNFVRDVTTREPYHIDGYGYRVTVIDYGVRRSLLKSLGQRGCSITVMPATSTVEQIIETEPDGIVLSNGPGDPRNVDYATPTIRELLGHRPMLGICLGHQILCRALGAEVFKLRYGHRGGNHPVKELSTGRVCITSQNHGYVIDRDTIDDSVVEVTHVSLNDGTVEGIRHRFLPAVSVQYHPESSPGPRDSWYVLDRFIDEIARFKLQEE
jgi:carbamoyl-phosphate synthase small subunit